MPIAAAISALGNLAATGMGIWYNKKQSEHLTGAQKEQNQFNADEAQKQRDYETEMSNTAYQRQTADMQAAGLNPALMYGGTGASGASTPSGSAASGSGQGGQQFDPAQMMRIMAESGIAMRQLKEEKRVHDAEIANIEADTLNKQANTRLSTAEAVNREWLNSDKMREIEKDTRVGSLKHTLAVTRNLENQDAVLSAQVQLINSQTDLNLTEKQYKDTLILNQKIANDVAEVCKEHQINESSYRAQKMYYEQLGESVKSWWLNSVGMSPESLSSNPVAAAGQLALCIMRQGTIKADEFNWDAFASGIKRMFSSIKGSVSEIGDEIQSWLKDHTPKDPSRTELGQDITSTGLPCIIDNKY